MLKVQMKLGILLVLSFILASVGVNNQVQASGMLAYDIGHVGTYDFECYGDTYTALMDIGGHMIISADRKTIDIYYDAETEHTNSFFCFIQAFNNNSLMSQRLFVNQQYFVPGYPGWDVNDDFTNFPSGHITLTYSKPVDKIMLGYSMKLKPDTETTINVSYELYKEIVIE